jgi:hypothetical protein
LYWIGVSSLVAVYVAVVWTAWATHTWSNNGPLAKTAASTWSPSFYSQSVVAGRLCDDGSVPASRLIVRGAIDRGHIYYACYSLDVDGTVNDALVVDERGTEVHDSQLIKRLGAWRWIGLVKTPGDLAVGGIAVLLSSMFWYLYYRPRRVRIQVLTHDLDQAEASKLEDNLADALDLRVVERSDPASEARVREAFEHGAASESAAGAADPQRPASRLPWRRGGA